MAEDIPLGEYTKKFASSIRKKVILNFKCFKWFRSSSVAKYKLTNRVYLIK